MTDFQKEADPWTLAEGMMHILYTEAGDWLDAWPTKKNSDTGREDMQSRTQNLLQWQDDMLKLFGGKIGQGQTRGTNKVSRNDGVDVTWNDYMSLQGNINPDGSKITEATPLTKRDKTSAQFWHKDHPKSHLAPFGYEVLADLFVTQIHNGYGKHDQTYKQVMNFTDLTKPSKIDPNKPSASPGYDIHDTFHDLRKRWRAAWRTPFFYPFTLPLMFGTMALSNPSNAKWEATKKDWKVCMKWQQKHSDGKPCTSAGGDLYFEFGVSSCYLPRCEDGYYVDGTSDKFKMPSLFDRRAMLGGNWRTDISSYWNVVDSSKNQDTWAYKGTPVLELLFQNDDASKQMLEDAGWDKSLIQLGTAMALGGYYHVKPCTASANSAGNPQCAPDEEQETPENLGRQIVWDWVERMGALINDKFFEWDYLKQIVDDNKKKNKNPDDDPNVKKKCDATPSQQCLDNLKKEVNDNWKTLKAWMEGGDFAAPINGKQSSKGNSMLWLQYSARSYADQPGFT
jgi:hypothetical protein